MNEAQYAIQFIARLTGLSAHVMRIWEHRYRSVEPHRTATKRRLYSRSEIDRLNNAARPFGALDEALRIAIVEKSKEFVERGAEGYAKAWGCSETAASLKSGEFSTQARRASNRSNRARL